MGIKKICVCDLCGKDALLDDGQLPAGWSLGVGRVYFEHFKPQVLVSLDGALVCSRTCARAFLVKSVEALP